MKNRAKFTAMLLCVALAVCALGFAACGEESALQPGDKAVNFIDSVTELKNEEGFSETVSGSVELKGVSVEIPSNDGLSAAKTKGDLSVNAEGEIFAGLDKNGNFTAKCNTNFAGEFSRKSEEETVETAAVMSLKAVFVYENEKVYYEYVSEKKYPLLSDDLKPDWEEVITQKDVITLSELADLISGGSQSESTPYYAYAETADVLPAWVIEKILPDITEFAQNEILPAVKQIIKEMKPSLEKAVAAAEKMYITVQNTDNGTEVYVDAAKIKEVNNDLYTVTIAEFIDKYYGDGTFAGIKEKLMSAADATVGDVIDGMAEKGITVADVVGLLDKIATSVAGTPSDAETLLGLPEGVNIEDLITDELRNAKITDWLAGVVGPVNIKTVLGTAFGYMESATFYQLLQTVAGETFDIAEMKDSVDGIIDAMGKIYSYKLTVDKNSAAFKSLEIDVSLSKQTLDELAGVFGELQQEYETVIEDLNAGINYKITKGRFANTLAYNYEAFVASFVD